MRAPQTPPGPQQCTALDLFKAILCLLGPSPILKLAVFCDCYLGSRVLPTEHTLVEHNIPYNTTREHDPQTYDLLIEGTWSHLDFFQLKKLEGILTSEWACGDVLSSAKTEGKPENLGTNDSFNGWCGGVIKCYLRICLEVVVMYNIDMQICMHTPLLHVCFVCTYLCMHVST